MKTSTIVVGAVGAAAVIYLLTKKSEAVTPCTADWQCESPKNGYEYDVNNCGSPRRLNSTCDPTVPVFDRIDVDCNPCSIRVTQPSTITATALDTAGNPVPDILINWTSTKGTVSPTSGTTNSSGITTTTFTAGNTTGTARITATNTASGITNYVDVTVTAAPALTTLTIDPPGKTLTSGDSQNFIATCKDQYDAPMSGLTVNWSQSPTLGTISPTSGTTNASGQTTTTFSAGTTTGDGTLTAQSGSVSKDVPITVSATPATLCSIVISPDNPNISVGTSVDITATCYDQYGIAISISDINAVMGCPTLDWNKILNPSYITITPVSNTKVTVTGVTVGTAKITASNPAPAC